eukprot:2939670-Alexandrium_andersonii.AAC.1
MEGRKKVALAFLCKNVEVGEVSKVVNLQDMIDDELIKLEVKAGRPLHAVISCARLGEGVVVGVGHA